MELRLSIRSLDPNVRIEIPNGEIAKGITIKQELNLKEILNPPLDFVVNIAEYYVLPVAATLTANYLYDKLKGRKDKPITINEEQVEINAENIEQLIIINLKKKKDE
ncbi:MAG: hypothetical protein ABSA75_11625 [Candidatus Bathyarchaeia archaeon]|jgi:hypothetical protein